MANHKRKRPRTRSRRKWDTHEPTAYAYWMCRWPAWWDIVFHTRPARARARALVRGIELGADPDNVSFDPARKPHHYYW